MKCAMTAVFLGRMTRHSTLGSSSAQMIWCNRNKPKPIWFQDTIFMIHCSITPFQRTFVCFSINRALITDPAIFPSRMVRTQNIAQEVDIDCQRRRDWNCALPCFSKRCRCKLGDGVFEVSVAITVSCQIWVESRTTISYLVVWWQLSETGGWMHVGWTDTMAFMGQVSQQSAFAQTKADRLFRIHFDGLLDRNGSPKREADLNIQRLNKHNGSEIFILWCVR